MLDLEKQYYNEKVNFIAGTDEAGRGCLLGPVVASAVIFPKDFFDEIYLKGAVKAQKTANKTLSDVYKKLGLN